VAPLACSSWGSVAHSGRTVEHSGHKLGAQRVHARSAPQQRDCLSLLLRVAFLQVEPFASLAGAVRSSVPRVLINRDLVGPFAWQQRCSDVAQLGDVVSGVEKLVELLGWTEEMQTLIQKEKEKVGRGSEPHLPPSASSFRGLELFWAWGAGLGLLGLDLHHRPCHACSLHSEKSITEK